jgi:hypothetical protein
VRKKRKEDGYEVGREMEMKLGEKIKGKIRERNDRHVQNWGLT